MNKPEVKTLVPKKLKVEMGDTLSLEKWGLIGIGQRGQGWAYRMSKVPFPYLPQALPLPAQSSREICLWPCGRRIFSLRIEVFSLFSCRIPAMRLRPPLAPPANCRAPFLALPPSSCPLCLLIRHWSLKICCKETWGALPSVGIQRDEDSPAAFYESSFGRSIFPCHPYLWIGDSRV